MSRHNIFSLGQTREERSSSVKLFLIGLASLTFINIGGYAAIAELILVIMLPYSLLRNIRYFNLDSCSSIIWLLIIWALGQFATDVLAHNYFAFMIRGLIPPIGTLAALLVVYPLLRKNPNGLKWIILGMAISGVISIFVFQPGAAAGNQGVLAGTKTAVEAVLDYKLFWVQKLNDWLGLPVKGWYLSMPHACNVLIALFLAFFALGAGGRSAFLVALVSAMFFVFGGKSSRKMQWLKRNWLISVLGLLVVMVAAKYTYQYAASSGWMGEEELLKYEEQSKGRSGLATLMQSRGEFFMALDAITDKPLMGHGSYALDYHGYRRAYFEKNGADAETLERIISIQEMRGGVPPIPAHSHIACFWMWAGIPGLLPWVYILVLLCKTLFKRMHVYPAYYGYFALIVPTMLWHIFFSPFGSRINMAVLIAACLVVQTMEREQRRMNGFMVKSW